MIEGNNIVDIPSFYREINRVFMHGENWEIGQSLDAFNDMLYGGFGIIQGSDTIRFIWKNFKKNKMDLGFETTKAFYIEKLQTPSRFNTDLIRKWLDALEKGMGKTFFEIVIDIIESHGNIELIEE